MSNWLEISKAEWHEIEESGLCDYRTKLHIVHNGDSFQFYQSSEKSGPDSVYTLARWEIDGDEYQYYAASRAPITGYVGELIMKDPEGFYRKLAAEIIKADDDCEIEESADCQIDKLDDWERVKCQATRLNNPTASPEDILEWYEGTHVFSGTEEEYFSEQLEQRIDELRRAIEMIPDHKLGNGWHAESIKDHRQLLEDTVRMLSNHMTGADYGRWAGLSVTEFEFEGADYCVV
tara:strand:+ start:52 stop:753 length:702 start_codon:yes stop_codon:yes gene_type:complete